MSAYATNQRLIDIRRKQEAKYREMDAAMAQDRKIYQMASFEQSTGSKINRRLKQERYNELKHQQDELLTQRRQQLANLYNNEMKGWHEEVMLKIETPEDRKQRIRERAYALRDMREQARQDFVREKLDQQWRDANDDARTLDSKALTNFMSRERLAQIEEKNRRKEKLTVEEDREYAEWNRQLDELELKDRQKREAMKQADLKTMEELKIQMADNIKKKQEHYLRTMEEDKEEIEAVRAAQREEELLMQKRREEEKQRLKEIMAYNDNYKRFQQEEKSIEQEQDVILLDYALRKEREAIEAEEMKKRASQEAARRYRAYLEEQMQKEAIDTAYVDEIRRQEEERVWKARDEALQAREEARKYLMKTVHEGRQDQIRERELAMIREKEEGKVFAQKFLDEARAGVLQERQEAEQRKLKAMENSQKLKNQIDHRQYQREVEKQETYLEDKQMQYMEKMHRQKLSEQGGVLRLNRPLLQGKWYS